MAVLNRRQPRNAQGGGGLAEEAKSAAGNSNIVRRAVLMQDFYRRARVVDLAAMRRTGSKALGW